jgi:hypothetical protein
VATTAAGTRVGTDAEASKSGVVEREHAPQFSTPGEREQEGREG